MKRKHKSYSRPKTPFDKVRIEEENNIKKEFGLKNKKEIWKAEAKIKSMREKAKKLIRASPEEQQILFLKLQSIGLNVHSIAEVLALNIKNYLERRLQTIVARKGVARTIKSSRQMINHKKILVDGNTVDRPSYIVAVDLENQISLKEKIKNTEAKKE